MSVGGSVLRDLAPGRGASAQPAVVVWHDLECGGYTADLELWRELADEACPANPTGQREPLLDVGAGSGRVALDLARHGHHVDAIDRDPDLLEALAARAVELPVKTVCADARSFELARRDYPLCVVPMQTIQLLAGPQERLAFLARARAHMRAGGLLACAIVTDIEPFDHAAGDPVPSPDIGRLGESTYESRPVRVVSDADGIAIERERRVVSAATRERREAATTVDFIRLARLSVSRLEDEGERAGFHRRSPRLIAATAEHVGSTVVMLRA